LREAISLYKFLSPQHLLKLPFANDSNTLDRRFYNELIHIIGLVETDDGGKRLITRKSPAERNPGSLLENTIAQLTVHDKISRLPNPELYGGAHDERCLAVALELVITWLNRILFLKLLEGQILAWNKDASPFLAIAKIRNYDDLNTLFFDVLACRPGERRTALRKSFAHVPYLNSSLFEQTDIEHNGIFISNLRDESLPVFPETVLRDPKGRKRTDALPTLAYLFDFLDAYDFGAEAGGEFRENNKTLINASVLGLIFEKLNGYKDGSFFTPGYITMYICRETLRRAIVQKFNEKKNWTCRNFGELYNKIDDIAEANEIINSLKICDPAVGSGHFLVSALNELIAIKHELRILCDRAGRRLKEYHIEVANDELIITDETGALFEYKPASPESRRVQEALFHEKQTLIESCLFGVDLNPNSVKICRLRLWIELLKNAYYKNDTELETLPNIDINIKEGNSLVNRFALDADLAAALKKSKWNITAYRVAIATYHNATGKAQKHEMEKLISEIKGHFSTEISKQHPQKHKLDKLLGEILLMKHPQLFELTKKEKNDFDKKLNQLTAEHEKLSSDIGEYEKGKTYERAFEWRFEFPDVLDDRGNFIGFDAIIGNPPYIRADEQSDWNRRQRETILADKQYQTLWEKWDIYIPFIERSIKLLRPGGYSALIVSDAFCHAKYAQKIQTWLLQNIRLLRLDFCGALKVFDAAAVHNVIPFMQKANGHENIPERRLHKETFGNITILPNDRQCNLTYRVFFPSDTEKQIFKVKTIPLNDILYITKGMVVHANEKKARGAFELKDLTSEKKTRIHSKPFIEGKHLDRWLPSGQKWLEWGTERAPALFSRPTFLKIYTVPEKLISVDMSAGTGSLRVAYDDAQLFHNHSAWSFVPWHSLSRVYNNSLKKVARYKGETPTRPNLPRREDLEANSHRFLVKYLLGVMNSTIARDFLRANRRSNIHLYPDDWKKLPIPDISLKKQAPIVTLVDRILAAKHANPAADTSTLESEIDTFVYRLYGLAPQEI
jgi:hypothetical protein